MATRATAMGAAAEIERRLAEAADLAAVEYGFTPAERQAWIDTQRRVLTDRSFARKVRRRQRKFERAALMSPTIKTRSK